MTQTLILLFHPNIEKSKANAALQAAARTIPGTLVVDIQARYPTGVIDMLVDGEAEALVNHDPEFAKLVQDVFSPANMAAAQTYLNQLHGPSPASRTII